MRSSTFVLLLFAARVFSQPAAPAFEVASIKSAADPGPYHWDAPPGMLRLRGMNLKQCILTAYHVQDFQVQGGPGWTDSDRFDIDAKADSPARADQLLLMLRTLLADRFQLTLQNKPRPAEGYTMVVSKGGLKIEPDAGQGPPAIQVNWGRMNVSRFPMVGLAGALSNILGVPVSDATGLSGTYSFNLEWTPDDRLSAMALPLPDALLEKIGLKLERGKVSIPVYVIEHVEKPSAN